jgi:hypothetical protein
VPPPTVRARRASPPRARWRSKSGRAPMQANPVAPE